jgi:hypothetical protein
MTDRSLKSTAGLDDAVARVVAIAALAGVAMVHVLQVPDAFADAGYLGALFVLVAVACIALAALMTRTSDDRLWLVSGALPVLVLIGYVLSRTSGLPGFSEDIGEWTEPLALIAIVFESLLISLSAVALAPHHAPMPAPRAPTTRPTH